MQRTTLVSSVAACFCLSLACPLLATEPLQPSGSAKNISTTKPTETCLSDLRAFYTQMEQDGYWLGGSPWGGYGIDYPIGPMSAVGYRNARPGYEVQILVAAANIFGRHGQQQPCEDALTTARDIYKLYVSDMRSQGVPVVDAPGWRKLQIAAAQPVTSQNISFRSDELLGIGVSTPQNEALGTSQLNKDQFTTAGHFDQESQKVDAYWKAHLSNNSHN